MSYVDIFFFSLLKTVCNTWIAARDDDERKRLLKEEEGLAVKRLPRAAPELLRRFASLLERRLLLL